MQVLRRSRLLAALAVGLIAFNLSPFGSVLCYCPEGQLQLEPTLAGVCLQCYSADLCCAGCSPHIDQPGSALGQPDSCACASSPDTEELVAQRVAAPTSPQGETIALPAVSTLPTLTVANELRPAATSLPPPRYCPTPIAVLRI
jgi:hypothetical protein